MTFLVVSIFRFVFDPFLKDSWIEVPKLNGLRNVKCSSLFSAIFSQISNTIHSFLMIRNNIVSKLFERLFRSLFSHLQLRYFVFKFVLYELWFFCWWTINSKLSIKLLFDYSYDVIRWSVLNWNHHCHIKCSQSLKIL